MNQGLIDEYYSIFKDALKVELGREPTHEEIMYHVNLILGKYYER